MLGIRLQPQKELMKIIQQNILICTLLAIGSLSATPSTGQTSKNQAKQYVTGTAKIVGVALCGVISVVLAYAAATNKLNYTKNVPDLCLTLASPILGYLAYRLGRSFRTARSSGKSSSSQRDSVPPIEPTRHSQSNCRGTVETAEFSE